MALEPGHADALRNHAVILRETGRFEEALADYDRLLAARPDDLDALNDRGNTLRALKRFEEALMNYDRALAVAPDLPETLNNKGVILSELQRPYEALACYDRALAAPGAAAAFTLNNRGKALCDLDRIGEGFVDFIRSAEIAHNESAAAPFTGHPLAHKTKHDEEQRVYLAELGLPPPDGKLRFADGTRLAGPAVNPRIDPKAVSGQWQTSKPKIVVIDNFLTDAALEGLRRFCWGSTMWRTIYKDGYLGAFPEQGFACPLLAQVAEELRDNFPSVFKGHPLRYLWAFKYDSDLSGTIVHADAAVVNVNFWITPDEASLDPESGGLEIWDKAAPPDWDFDRYNGEAGPIEDFLVRSGAKPTTVP
jgi:tetratricopeptide (TPR) repeat protein